MDHLKVHETFLCKLVSTKRKKGGELLINTAKPLQLDILCELILNTIKGVLPIPKQLQQKFTRYKLILRRLTLKCLKRLVRKELIIKYFLIVRDLVAAVLPLCGVIGKTQPHD
jgi:hypothetical protein